MKLLFYVIIWITGSSLNNSNVLGTSIYSNAANDGYCRDKTLGFIGDINIAVPVSIHDNLKERECGDISIHGFQTAIAVEWIAGILNGNESGSQFIPGINIGYTIYDDCGLPWRTSNFLTDILQRDCANSSYDAITYAGILSVTSDSSSSQAIKMSHLDVLLISINQYRQVRDQAPNVFFGRNSTAEEIKVILQFMYESAWSFIGVVYTADIIGQEYYTELLKQSKGLDNCYLQLVLNETNADNVVTSLISELYSFAANQKFGVLYLGSPKHANIFINKIRTKTLGSNLMIILPSAVGTNIEIKETTKTLTNELFFVSPYKVTFDKFREYFKTTIESDLLTHDPWRTEYIKRICSIKQIERCKADALGNFFIQETNVDKTIAAVLSIAIALKNMQAKYCNGNKGVCQPLMDNLANITAFLKNTNADLDSLAVLATALGKNVSFGFNADRVLTLGKHVFDINHHKLDSQTLTGEYINEQLRLNQTATESVFDYSKNGTRSRCIESANFKFGYLPGDVYILGLFSIHQDATVDGDEDSLFKCGDFRHGTNAVVTVSAFMESVKSMRKKVGINFGAIALDDCYNELNISVLITELFSGKRILYDPVNGKPIDFFKVISVIGALSSRVTQRVADIMSSLHIPMVSYGASATTLDNRIRYPYFFRTVPSDALQVQGMVSLLSSLNIYSAGSLYIDDAYGKSGINEVISEGKRGGICISEGQIINEDSYPKYIREILDGNYKNNVKVVVIFSMDSVVKKILGVLANKSDNVMSNYAPIFISSEGWGTGLELANKESLGSLILITDSSKQVSETFSTYLQSLSPLTSVTENPWIYRFWEDHFDCYMPRSFERQSQKRCDMSRKLTKDFSLSFAADQRIVHTEIAVNAIGYAYMRYNRTCSSPDCLKRNASNALNFTKHIQEIRIPLFDGTNFKPFKGDNNGNLGFTIYNVQGSDNVYSYVKVGSYNGTLKLQRNMIKFYDHLGYETPLQQIACPSHCNICLKTTPDQTSTTPVNTIQESSQDVLTYAVGGIAGVLFLIVLLLIVIVFKALRSKERKEEQRNHFSTESLSTRNQHCSQTSLDEIYHEAHPVDNITESPNTHHNIAFQHDSNSNQSMSFVTTSTAITSDSAGSNVVYSKTMQSAPNSSQENKYISLASSNESLNILTKRVLQSHSTPTVKRPDDVGNLTYLSAKDLDMTDEEENQSTPVEPNKKFVKSENTEIDTPSPMELVSQINRNMVIPPRYPVKGQTKDTNLPFSVPGNPQNSHTIFESPKSPNTTTMTYLSAHDLQMKDKEQNLGENGKNCNGVKVYSINGYVQRPLSLPGLRPVHLSPEQETIRNTKIPYHLDMHDNDMYLHPVSDSLPTYQEHLLLQQKLNKTKTLKGENSPITTGTNSYITQNMIFSPSSGSPHHGFSYINGVNMLSPTSSFCSPSSSAMSLSPFHREALQANLLVKNPHYYRKSPGSSMRSPISSIQSPQSNISSLDSKRESPKSIKSFSLSELDGVDDREEVII